MASKKKYKPYEEVALIVRHLGITTRKQYSDWWRATKPPLIPGCPPKVYPQWTGWADFLGTNNRKRYNPHTAHESHLIKQARDQALLRGDKVFFVGVPCAQGHTVGRRTDSGNCCECQRIRARDYARRHAEENRARSIEWKKHNVTRANRNAHNAYLNMRKDPVRWAEYLRKQRERYARKKAA